ncbi:MAG: hypothetical protein IJC48_05665 [Clostridia bacterium]|nr:hypothetical protein [Clostridia bacterium]
MNYWRQSDNNIYVAAHRGWSERYPENTLEAFRSAMDLGVDQVETDIRVTKDGELVLIHDATVDRTTYGSGKVNELTLEEIRALDAGKVKNRPGEGYRVPTLQEFIDLLKEYPLMTTDFELKEYPIDGNEEAAFSVCDRVLKMIEDNNLTDRCVINTFSARLHEYIQEKYPGRFKQHVYFPLSHMGDYTINPYEYAYCVCMFGSPYMADTQSFEKMRVLGVRPWAGAAVKDEQGVDEAIRQKAELITCNNPDVILSLLKKKGKHE